MNFGFHALSNAKSRLQDYKIAVVYYLNRSQRIAR
jgi:hypothetical protein